MTEVRIHPEWKAALGSVFDSEEFARLTAFVREEYRTAHILPPAPRIFSAFDLCPLSRIRVVILGQDPYPTPGHAHGLCFSVEPQVRPLPKSLLNIFSEIHRDLGIPPAADGNLERWARQGVFLLNAILTVRAGEPASHRGRGWEWFTDRVISELSLRSQPMVFMLWGNFAQSKIPLINADRHLVLTAPHPSPLSAHRGFLGCDHFSRANQWLTSRGIDPVKW